MNIRKIFIICAVLLAVCVNFYSQDFSETMGAESEKAEKVDEFGRAGECELSLHLDNFFVLLMKKETAKGVIIAYQGANTLPAHYDASTVRQYHNYIHFRNFDASRIEIIDGGFRKAQSAELWIVPPGAQMPQPSETVTKPELPTDKTFLYDRNYLVDSYYYGIDYLDEYLLPEVKAEREADQKALEEQWKSDDSEEPQTIEEETEPEQPKTPEEIEAEKFFWVNEKFGEVIKNQKDASGVMIFYADDQIYDIAKLQTFIDEGRRKIAKEASISPAKIQIVFGGYRQFAETEFWIMPKNGEFPAPSPETRPIEESEDETIEENF